MKKKTDLPKLLEEQGAVPAAVGALIRGLTAKRSFNQNGKTVSEDDSATQVRAAVALLTWAAPQPLKAKLGDEPGPKKTGVEREEEIKRILGIE